MSNGRTNAMTDILRGTFFEAMNIRNLLENSNIEIFTVNEYMSNIKPWVVTSGGFNPVTLRVNIEDFEKAKKIIENFENGELILKP